MVNSDDFTCDSKMYVVRTHKFHLDNLHQHIVYVAFLFL